MVLAAADKVSENMSQFSGSEKLGPETIFNAKNGRARKLIPIKELFELQFGENRHKVEDAENLAKLFEVSFGPTMDVVASRIKYLGLDKNLLVDGPHSALITKIIRALNFGHETPEDRGTVTGTARNVVSTGTEPDSFLFTPVSDGSGELIPPMKDDHLRAAVFYLTNPDTHTNLRESFPSLSDTDYNWVIQQVAVRRFIPRESLVQPRRLNLSELTLVKYLGNDPDSDPGFQASNPVSVWVDKNTNRKFIVKECPEQTLQADYFGLEALHLIGVPIYEFYFGERPNDDGTKKTVLISGFLEGFQDPSKLVSLPAGAPDEMIKTLLPDKLKNSPLIKRAMLMEILIGEYNSKAHNFMALGDSAQHLDQGGCLTSTASGKFKGFSPEITVQDVQDVIHCYSDWDPNLEQSTNEAYATVATVENGKIVIHDRDMAHGLLLRMRNLNVEDLEEALEHAGYANGAASIDRLTNWIKKIDRELIPQYEAKEPSLRQQQYLRWLNSARTTFSKAIEMGGELEYYKYALRQRKASLEKLWAEALGQK